MRTDLVGRFSRVVTGDAGAEQALAVFRRCAGEEGAYRGRLFDLGDLGATLGQLDLVCEVLAIMVAAVEAVDHVAHPAKQHEREDRAQHTGDDLVEFETVHATVPS